MNQVIGNNEIYYMFTCPRMFYFFLQEETDNVVVENALENDRIKNVQEYFKNVSWVNEKKREISNRFISLIKKTQQKTSCNRFDFHLTLKVKRIACIRKYNFFKEKDYEGS